jgi:hypothetical protein
MEALVVGVAGIQHTHLAQVTQEDSLQLRAIGAALVVIALEAPAVAALLL